MRYFPAFLDLSGKAVLVVGGGVHAARKAELLLRAGARPAIVAPALERELAALAARHGLPHRPGRFVPADLDGRILVIAASGEAAQDGQVADAAKAAGIPVNVVDRADLSSFTVPALIDRDPIVIGISTAGSAPLLARRIRAQIEALLPARLGRLARIAERFRGAVQARFPDPTERRRFWERFFDGPVAEAILRGDEKGASEGMLSAVNGRTTPESGRAAIVGAGPGDPELLTLKAHRLLQEADVIIHDRLVSPAVLDLARRDAARIDVGKAPGRHSHSQAEINALIAREAEAGRRVVRLKGGDPFLFGRGGEEVDYLRARGLPVEVVPGITAATGCAAAAGIPLTHRDHVAAVTFVTGHGKDGEPALDWSRLSGADHTLVVYMGVRTAGRIAARLIAAGRSADTPVAVIENGTLPEQKAAAGRLADLESLIDAEAIAGPALIVIGEVVRHADPAVLAATYEPVRYRALAV